MLPSGQAAWLPSVGLSGIHEHSRGEGALWASWAPCCLAPRFSLPGGSCCGRAQQSRVQRRSSDQSGGLGQAGCLPACLFEEGNPRASRDLAGLPFPFFSLGPDFGKGGWCESPEVPAQALLNRPAKLLCAAIF